MKRSMFRWFAVALILPLYASGAFPQRATAPSDELNTILFHATFRIEGPDKNDPNKTTFGTVFVMGVPLKNEGKLGSLVLITAAHVLDGIAGDVASLTVRRPNSDGSYTAYNYNVPIRTNGQPLYVKHKDADVAAMYVDLPNNVPITGLVPDSLADDQRLKYIEVHPGDEVFCLGFPLAANGPGGFPILRSGHIASYPLTPMETVEQIELDMLVLPGNSGGPVYYSYENRIFKHQIHLGLFQGILGLVIQSTRSALPEYTNQDLNFGVILPAPFIRQTIDMLPPKS